MAGFIYACLTVRACRFCTCPIDFETVAGVLRKEDATVKGPPTISSVTYTLARGTGSVVRTTGCYVITTIGNFKVLGKVPGKGTYLAQSLPIYSMELGNDPPVTIKSRTETNHIALSIPQSSLSLCFMASQIPYLDKFLGLGKLHQSCSNHNGHSKTYPP